MYDVGGRTEGIEGLRDRRKRWRERMICYVYLSSPPLYSTTLPRNNNRAGELTQEKLEEVIAIVSNPKAFKIPEWFLNRQRDWKTNKASQATSNVVDTKLREDLERLKKIR